MHLCFPRHPFVLLALLAGPALAPAGCSAEPEPSGGLPFARASPIWPRRCSTATNPSPPPAMVLYFVPPFLLAVFAMASAPSYPATAKGCFASRRQAASRSRCARWAPPAQGA